MAVTLYHVGRRPGQTQFGLDSFTESYKANDPAGTVMTDVSVPQKGDAHPSYAGMFVTDRYCTETGPSSSALELVYTGTLTEDLPPIKHDSGRAIQSATTYTSSAIYPAVATQPASLQYYAPTNIITLFSTSPTTVEEPDDPADITVDDLITWTLAAEQPAGDLTGIADWLLANAFVQRITEVTDATEVVADQFWQITKRKTKLLLPYAPLSS